MFTMKVEQPVPVLPFRGHRRLVLVDIENFIGGAIFTAGDVTCAQHLIASLIGPINSDLATVGVSHMGMFSVHQSWGGARMLVQSGPDGADLKLLEELCHDDIASRFDEVVLISGDGIFTESVAKLTARSVKVTVVAPSDGCSRRLEMAANATIKFDRLVSKGDVA